MSIDLDAIQARADAATEGPWETTASLYPDGSRHDHVTQASDIENDICETLRTPQGIEDAEFIANARTDVPALLAYARDLEARIGRVEALIEKPFASADKRHYRDDFNRGHCAGYNAAAGLLRAAVTATDAS